MLSHLSITPSTSQQVSRMQSPDIVEEAPPPSTSHEPDHFDDELEASNEASPLLPPPPPPRTNSGHDLDDSLDEHVSEHLESKRVTSRSGDVLFAFLALGSLAAITIFTWILVFSQPKAISTLRFFAFHPPLQTLAVLLFAVGIVELQPTSKNAPRAKKRGLARHQLIQLGLGVPVLIVGSIMMIYNKVDHGAPHFTSWHGKFGLIAICWIFVQALVGGLSVWFKGKALGGEERGKSAWKWHRLSGYLLFPFLLVTMHLAGGHADWVRMKTTGTERLWIYAILPVIAFIGVAARLRPSKLPFFMH